MDYFPFHKKGIINPDNIDFNSIIFQDGFLTTNQMINTL